MRAQHVHAPTHLHASLSEVDLERQFLACVNIGVVGLGEDALQLLELRTRERGADTPLLAFLMQARRLREELVGHCRCVREGRGNESRVREKLTSVPQTPVSCPRGNRI